MLNAKDQFSLIGEVKWIKRSAYTKSGRKAYGRGKIISESPWMKNKVVANSGRGIHIFLDRLASINTYSGNITHGDIGTGTTPVTSSDTALEAGVARATAGAKSRSGSQTSIRFFFPDATTPDDTYTEFGSFIDGSSTLGTGRLFNHLLFSVPLVKATGEDNAILVRVTGNV